MKNLKTISEKPENIIKYVLITSLYAGYPPPTFHRLYFMSDTQNPMFLHHQHFIPFFVDVSHVYCLNVSRMREGQHPDNVIMRTKQEQSRKNDNYPVDTHR